ncbi:MAG: hypothetical protein M3506_00380 [Chloroflexota bacterium]|nr:hypothetical protein [Chloroflexota bacterium]
MDSKFIIQRQGKDVVLYQGLLSEAHASGLRSIETDLVQIPHPDNGDTAIVRARVTLADDRMFTGIGDANRSNVGSMIAQHIIRMAETRAKARALRDAVNIGMVSLEELGEDDPPATSGKDRPSRQEMGKANRASEPPEKPARPQNAAESSTPPAQMSREEMARVVELKEAIAMVDSRRDLTYLGKEIASDDSLTDAVRAVIRPVFTARQKEVG